MDLVFELNLNWSLPVKGEKVFWEDKRWCKGMDSCKSLFTLGKKCYEQEAGENG